MCWERRRCFLRLDRQGVDRASPSHPRRTGPHDCYRLRRAGAFALVAVRDARADYPNAGTGTLQVSRPRKVPRLVAPVPGIA